MTSVLLLLPLLLCVGATGSRSRPAPLSRLETGQREFNRGDPQAALRALDAAALETTDPKSLGRIHLLRGQCLAAEGNFGETEAAFGLALQSDPEVTLDPAKVDPAVVKLLDGLRTRLAGQLVVHVNQAGAAVRVDGAPFPAEVVSSATAGHHTLSATTADGRYAGQGEVVVRPREKTEVSISLTETGKVEPASRYGRPFADLRITVDPFQLDYGLEVGGGLELPHYRLSLHARVFPEFGLDPRAGFSVPLTDKVTGYVELELPLIFLHEVAFGLGGAGGAELAASKWIAPFLQLGARHFFFAPGGYEGNRLTLQAGARLRLP